MFNADFFRFEFPKQIAAQRGNPIVQLHLASGLTFRAHSLQEISEGWIAFDAYPLSGRKVEFRKGWEDRPAGEPDRLIVAYEWIANVQFLIDEDAKEMGFHTSR